MRSRGRYRSSWVCAGEPGGKVRPGFSRLFSDVRYEPRDNLFPPAYFQRFAASYLIQIAAKMMLKILHVYGLHI